MHDAWMAVKTITIDAEAYEILARLKGEGQSFSQIIKEHLGRRRGRDLQRVLRGISVSEETLDLIEAQVERRRESPASAAELEDRYSRQEKDRS